MTPVLAADTFSIPATRTAQPPLMDGRVDDEVWARAPLIADFTQVEPVPGGLPSSITEVRVLFDERTLYISVRAFDPEPQAITARQLQRDTALDNDDHFTLVLGPFSNARDGYLFRINALGAQQDGLVYDGAELRTDWDGLWQAEARIDEEGWTAEIAIPFTTLSFDPAIEVWHLNLERRIARTNERIRWRGARQELDVSALQVAGQLSGLSSLRQGLGLRLKPSLSLITTHDAGSDKVSVELEPSLDAFYQLSPSSTLALTFNTDFAETEIDERRVNLTRFPLFFPEKREYFLQDAGLFEFGGIGESPLPFFSRRIGLDDAGEPVQLNIGAKLTGRSGRYDYGLLSTQVDDSRDAPQKVLSVARAKANLSANTSLGFIATNGDPGRDADARLYGLDARYRTDEFAGQARTLNLGVYAQHTESEGLASGSAYGAFLNYPNPGWIGNVSLAHIDPGYRPALGFVSETDLCQSAGEFGYWKTTESGADIIPQLDWNVRLSSDNRFLSSTLNPEIYLENPSGDYLFPELFLERERLNEDFEIIPGLVIPAGEYRYQRFLGFFGTSQDRVFSIEGSIACCDFYDGIRRDLSLDLAWRPSARFNLGVGAELNDLDLPGGSFPVQVYSVAADWRFSRKLTLNNLIQFDNISNNIGINSRLRYRFAPGGDLFVVLNHNADGENGFTARDTSLTLKLSYNFLL